MDACVEFTEDADASQQKPIGFSRRHVKEPASQMIRKTPTPVKQIIIYILYLQNKVVAGR